VNFDIVGYEAFDEFIRKINKKPFTWGCIWSLQRLLEQGEGLFVLSGGEEGVVDGAFQKEFIYKSEKLSTNG
jgi:hypothetical protein